MTAVAAPVAIEPVDPNSEHGRDLADRLTVTLADLLLAVQAREQVPAEHTRDAA